MVGALDLASSELMVASYVPDAPVCTSTCTPVFSVYISASCLYWSTTSDLLFMKYTWPLSESALLPPPQAANDTPMANAAATAHVLVMIPCFIAYLLRWICCYSLDLLIFVVDICTCAGIASGRRVIAGARRWCPAAIGHPR